MGAAALLTITRNGENVRSQSIEGEVILGRSENCGIRLDDRAVSRQHAILRVVGEGVQIEKKSDYGALVVNGADCSQAVVKEGDVIAIGPYMLRLSIAKKEAVQSQAVEEPNSAERADSASEEQADGAESAAVEGADPAAPVEGAEGMDGVPAAEGEEGVEGENPVVPDGGGFDPPAADVEQLSNAEPSGEFLANDGDGKTRVGTMPKIVAMLRLIAGMASPEEVSLDKPEIALGRGQACDVVLGDKKSSRKHAVIRQSGIRYIIKDLDSANGTLVNGNPIREHELSSDDIIKIGEVELQFVAVDQEYEAQQKDFIKVEHDEPEPLQMDSMVDGPIDQGIAMSGLPASAPPGLEMQQKISESPTGGISGISGIPGTPGAGAAIGKKQSLIQKFRAMPPKKQAIYGAVAVALLWFLFEDDEPEKKGPMKKKAGVTAQGGNPNALPSGQLPADPEMRKRMDYQRLSAEQRKFIESQYALAFDFYRNKEYDKTLFELEKIFVLVQDYERAREIESYAREGKRKLESLQEEKRRKEEEEKLKKKVKDYELELQRSSDRKDYDKCKEIIVELLTLDPDNAIVNKVKKVIEAYEDQKRLEEQQKQVQLEINGRAAEMVKQGQKYQQEGRYYDAMDAVAKVSEIGASDPEPARLAKLLVEECKNTIRRKRDPILAKAKAKEVAGEHRAAYELYRKATYADPRHPAGFSGMARIRNTLHQMAKVIYTAAVMAESFSDFQIAQDKFHECMSVAPEDDIYYSRSKSRLVKYMGQTKRKPAGSESEGEGTK